MDVASQVLLTKFLAFAGLIGATIEYAEIVKRRSRRTAGGMQWRESNGAPRQLASEHDRPTAPSSLGRLASDAGWAAVGLIALVITAIVRVARAVRQGTQARRVL